MATQGQVLGRVQVLSSKAAVKETAVQCALRAWLNNLYVPYTTKSTVLLFPGHSFVRTFLTVQDSGFREMPSSKLTLSCLWF